MRRTRKRRRRLLSTSSARLARRSLTSTSPLLTRVDVVVEIVDAAVEAVVKDEDAAVADAVMVKDSSRRPFGGVRPGLGFPRPPISFTNALLAKRKLRGG